MTASSVTSLEFKNVLDAYESRVPLLKTLAERLHNEVAECLSGIPRIERISFREKSATSFAKKAAKLDQKNKPKYVAPLTEIEDQVAGRVLVHFRADVEVVSRKILSEFSRVEFFEKKPSDFNAFDYESTHFVLQVPPSGKPAGWEILSEAPTTFELQVRTLFMHAWAETSHDLMYKPPAPLLDDEKRRLAWAASNAWGSDSIFQEVFDAVTARAARNDTTR